MRFFSIPILVSILALASARRSQKYQDFVALEDIEGLDVQVVPRIGPTYGGRLAEEQKSKASDLVVMMVRLSKVKVNLSTRLFLIWPSLRLTWKRTSLSRP